MQLRKNSEDEMQSTDSLGDFELTVGGSESTIELQEYTVDETVPGLGIFWGTQLDPQSTPGDFDNLGVSWGSRASELQQPAN
jgi:hypothetical protein